VGGHRSPTDDEGSDLRTRFPGAEHIPATRLGDTIPITTENGVIVYGLVPGMGGWLGTVERDGTVQRIAFQAQARSDSPNPC